MQPTRPEDDTAARYARLHDQLVRLRNRGSRYGVERMRALVAELGNPQASFPCIHVAGTNGKGSVCALVEAALRRAGYRTGLYTSPHLRHLGERVQVDREPLGPSDCLRLVERVRPAAAAVAAGPLGEEPSFFEWMTALAFLRFAEAEVDCAVLETGLGGRLDATNVVESEAAVLTSVGLDHCEQLGNTRAQIAGEKAGIFRAGRPVVLGLLAPEAEAVARERAAALGSPVLSVGESFASAADYPETNLYGAYQRRNAATAWLTLDAVADRFPVPAEIRRTAFRSVHWPGRWEERVVGGRTVILDCTHNEEGARALGENLRERLGPPHGALEVVVGTLGRDRVASLLPVLLPYARALHLVAPDQPRALAAAEIAALVPPTFAGEVRSARLEEVFPSPDSCGLPGSPAPVLLTGSLYLLAEVLERLEPGAAPEGPSTVTLQDRI